MRTLLIWHAAIIGYLVVGIGMAVWLLRVWSHVDKDAGPWIVLLWPVLLPFRLAHNAFALLGRIIEEMLP